MGELVKLLTVFQEFFNYSVPLGVCIVVAIVVAFLFNMLQNNRRKDYETSYNHQSKVIEQQEKLLENRNKRISELEDKLLKKMEG